MHLTEVQAAEVLRRYLAGDRPVDIAMDFGVTEWTVQNVRKRAGAPARPHGMTDADIAHAASLHASGTSLRGVSRELGFSAATITKQLRLRGFIP